MTTISIIIPIYNCEEYLAECVDSILGLDKGDYQTQIILIDDGSKDNSPAICDYYATKYDNVITRHIPNSGVSVARNVGIDLATGDWLMFVDADDKLIPSTLTELTSLKDFNSYDVVRFGAFRFTNDGKKFSFNDGYSYDLENYRNKVLLGHTVQGVWGGIYKRTLVVENNIRFMQGLRMAEDGLVTFEILCHSKHFKYVNRQFYAYRLNPSSVTNARYKDVILEDSFRAVEAKLRYATDHGVSIFPRVRKMMILGLRYGAAMKKALITNKRENFIVADKLMAAYCPQSLLTDITHSWRWKQIVGVILYRIVRPFKLRKLF